MKAIDVHGHFGPYDRGHGGLMARLYTGDIEVVRRRAQAVDIRLTVVSAIHALIPYGGDVLRANRDAQEVAERYADIRFWAVLDPRLPESYKQVEKLLEHAECKGIKIHPREHFYEIREYGEAIFAFAAEQEALILTHSGHPGSWPEDFIPFANRNPGVRLIMAHLGNSTEDESLSRQVYALKYAQEGNVYVDTSSSASINAGLIEWAVEQVGAERVLFGTDTPLYFTASQKARVEYAEIDQEAKRAILFVNAAKLLNEEGMA